MYEQKTQLRVIAALLIVVIALAAGLFFYMPEAAQVGTTLQPEPEYIHEKVRDATISLDPSLICTQAFGGSKSEEVVDVFFNDGLLYLFGNTSSDDYDFDSAGAFLAIFDQQCKTLGFMTYGGTLKAVTLYQGGFVMAIDNNSTPIALAVDYNGEELKSISLPCVRAEIALDLKVVDGGYLFVTSMIQNVSGYTRLKMTMLSNELEFSGSVVTDEVYSLEYIDTLDIMGEYVLVANALSDIRNMLCLGKWGSKLAHYPKDFSYTVCGLWVTDGVYYLAKTDGSTALIKDDGTIIELTAGAYDCAIAGEDEYIYVSANQTFFCIHNSEVIFSAEYGPTSFYMINSYVYALSAVGSRLCVRAFESGKKIFESSFAYEITDTQIFICEGGMFIVGKTDGGFGENDITIIKVNS